MRITIEILLLVLLGLRCIYISASDLKRNFISNRVLFIAGSIGLILDVFYYAFLFKDLVTIFLINLLIMIGIAILLYALHTWAAGDSKFIILIGLLFPCGLNWRLNSLLSGSWWIAIFAILLGYLYVITVTTALKFQRVGRRAISFIVLPPHIEQ